MWKGIVRGLIGKGSEGTNVLVEGTLQTARCQLNHEDSREGNQSVL